MARKATGQVIEPQDGRAWALRFRAYGKRRYVTLGTAEQGWNRQRAEAELRHVLADVERGVWQPHEPAPVTVPAEVPTFHEFASEWFEAIRHEGLAESTIENYRNQLTLHLLPFFADHRLDQITVAEVDSYRQAKVQEAERLAHERERELRKPPAKRKAGMAPRPLGANSINKTITRLGQILDVALERELIDRNPVRVNPRRRKLKVAKPQRSYLDRADQIASLLDAAGELDREAQANRRATSRRALLATLVFAGLRIGEACRLRWRDVDLASGRLLVREGKTDAGSGRMVDLVPALRDELIAWKATTRHGEPEHPVFPTERGRQHGRENLRNRVFDRSVGRANRHRGEADLHPLPEGLTPHALRRTYASLLLARGDEVPYVMGQLGHADPTVTLGIYARVMFREDGERERLRALIEGADWAATGSERDFSGPERLIGDGDREPENAETPHDERGSVERARQDSNLRPRAPE